VADGEFYCIAKDAERVRPGDPRVYAERDREGDREILYFDGVEVKRITNNNYDDFAPSFDEKTLRIVWQAMLNDRLQVMYHDIRTDTTRQITTSRQNSSNPHIKGDIIVWQEWVDNNWEIMMTNVRGDGELETQRLTDNVMHDMFPQVYDGLITWQREKGRSWEVIVYDLQTGKEMALEKNSDTRYENPRFVLLFDSKHDNGDVQTIGYDLNTGEMMQLGTRSRPEPAPAPITPDSETPDALAREAASSTQIKVGREGDDADDDLDIEL
jgi:beta propeller repeat protein